MVQKSCEKNSCVFSSLENFPEIESKQNNFFYKKINFSFFKFLWFLSRKNNFHLRKTKIQFTRTPCIWALSVNFTSVESVGIWCGGAVVSSLEKCVSIFALVCMFVWISKLRCSTVAHSNGLHWTHQIVFESRSSEVS